MTQGHYVIPNNPDLPRDFTHKRLKVGPFRVLVRNKQHYRLYTCEVRGVEILKQASLPSVDELMTGLTHAVNGKKIKLDDSLRAIIKDTPLGFAYNHKKRVELKRKGGVK